MASQKKANRFEARVVAMMHSATTGAVPTGDHMTGTSSTSRRKPAHRTKTKGGTKSSARRKKPVRKWSGRVTATSDALDLKQGVFKQRSAAAIARSLKRSAEQS